MREHAEACRTAAAPARSSPLARPGALRALPNPLHPPLPPTLIASSGSRSRASNVAAASAYTRDSSRPASSGLLRECTSSQCGSTALRLPSDLQASPQPAPSAIPPNPLPLPARPGSHHAGGIHPAGAKQAQCFFRKLAGRGGSRIRVLREAGRVAAACLAALPWLQVRARQQADVLQRVGSRGWDGTALREHASLPGAQRVPAGRFDACTLPTCASRLPPKSRHIVLYSCTGLEARVGGVWLAGRVDALYPPLADTSTRRTSQRVAKQGSQAGGASSAHLAAGPGPAGLGTEKNQYHALVQAEGQHPRRLVLSQGPAAREVSHGWPRRRRRRSRPPLPWAGFGRPAERTAAAGGSDSSRCWVLEAAGLLVARGRRALGVLGRASGLGSHHVLARTAPMIAQRA